MELDFPAVQPKSSIGKNQSETRQIMSVRVIYENGDMEAFLLPKDQGFVRKRYTLLQGEQKGEVLLCYDIHWALKGRNASSS